MNIQILLILSLVGFGAAGLISDLTNGLTGGIKNLLNKLDSDLKNELEENYPKLGEWVKKRIDEGLDVGNSEKENVEAIAGELLNPNVEVPEEVEKEGPGFLSQYREQLRAAFDKLLEKIIEEFEHGKDISDRTLERIRDYLEELKQHGVDLPREAAELLRETANNLSDQAKEFYKRFLERLGIKNE
ncbi:hypothetical protein L3Y34_016317 [Caenorhabditis briggsae]|uniref:Uncharacterized protein n=1 Tax=Caenorhabditis briggsae TaxID=6238 RepID=A0AAE9DXC7_CAEBR|nr:hypothetical protein L3Y34_016317 [Caenorhabditis briggsae]